MLLSGFNHNVEFAYVKMNSSRWLSLLIVAISVIGCKHEPILPPEEPPTPLPDCSYSFTEAVDDTVWTLPPPAPIGIHPYQYQGYSIRDISFNPKNPNELAIAIYVHDGFEDLLGYDHGMLLMIYNLCSGERTIISEPVNQFPLVHSIDWGRNDILLFGTNSHFTPSGDVAAIATMKSNGDSIVMIPHNRLGQQIHNVKWSWLESSILVSSSSHSEAEIDFHGNDISTDLGVPNNADLLYRSPFELLYIGASVGMLNTLTGSLTTFGNSDGYSGYRDIALTIENSSLFWSSSSEIVLYDFESSIATTLKTYDTWKDAAYSATTSSNNYLAYVVSVSSASLTTSTDQYIRDEIRFINPDGSDERRLILNFD